MRSYITALLAAVLLPLFLEAQYTFIIPTHYHGIFSDQLTSARAQGMGYTTTTIDGIATTHYNPATISPGNTKLDLAFNYANGHPYYPKSRYPFIGISYRITPKLVIGGSMFAWIDAKSYWTATIGGQEFDTEKKKQFQYSLIAGYEVMENLHVGVSGNLIRDQAIDDYTTAEEFIVNVGVIYDRPVNLLKKENFTDQKLRFAASLTNALMNARTEQRYEDILNYRDMPIILRLGAAYGFTIPLGIDFTKNKKFFAESPELLDITARVQYQDFLPHKDHLFRVGENSTAFGIGFEAWFMRLLALRIGYYTEDRSNRDEDIIRATTPSKAGFTWGFGANIPVKRLTGGRIPVDIEANFVTSRMMDELEDEKYNLPSVFGDKRFQFCIGINVRYSN